MLMQIIISMMLMTTFETTPLNYPPCPVSEQVDPLQVLKILQDKYYIISYSNQDNVSKKIRNNKAHNNFFWHTFKNRKPFCKTVSIEIPDLIDKVTIPNKIMEVTLVNELGKLFCKQVKKEIVYLEEEKYCNNHINARMYVIKRREIVVAYEYMT
nr:uncharacterized protein LOC105847538 [Hydra vulgaris]